MKLFFVIFARDRKYVVEKIKELEGFDVPYMIVCGERMNHPRVVYRAPRGKYDAVNLAEKLTPEDVDIVAFNDVDARLCNFQAMLSHFKDRRVAIVFASELVREGLQYLFFKIFNPIRRRILLAAWYIPSFGLYSDSLSYKTVLCSFTNHLSIAIGFREEGVFLDEGDFAWRNRLFALRSDWSLAAHLHGIRDCGDL